MLAVVIAFTLLGSLIFAAPSSNSTIGFVLVAFILVLGRHLNKVALQFPEPRRSLLYSLYYAMPHLELFDLRDLIIHDWPPIGWQVCGLATLYGLAYAAVFLLIASVVFRRRAVN